MGNFIRKKSPVQKVIIFRRSVKYVGHKLTGWGLTLDLPTISTQKSFSITEVVLRYILLICSDSVIVDFKLGVFYANQIYMCPGPLLK